MSTQDSQRPEPFTFAGVGPDGLRRVYAVLYGLAMADGTFEARELQVLEKYRNDFQITEDEAHRIEDEVDAGGKVQLAGDSAELDTARRAMFEIATVDGILAKEEETLLVNITEATGYTVAHLQAALAAHGLSLSQDRLRDAGLLETSDDSAATNDAEPEPDGEATSG